MRKPTSKQAIKGRNLIFRLTHREDKELEHLAARYTKYNKSEMLRRLIAAEIKREVKRDERRQDRTS